MFIIGIDPHKASHTAAVLDGHEQLVSEVRVCADRSQRDRLLAFAASFEPRCWAIEGATGTGALLAQQLVAVGETVLDVPPALSARVRLLDNERSDKTDAHDARSAAIVALRHSKLRVVGLEDHTAVLRLLAKRHHDLVAHRTRAICRLHTLLCHLVAGGLPQRLSATRADSRAAPHPTRRRGRQRTSPCRPRAPRRSSPHRRRPRRAQGSHHHNGGSVSDQCDRRVRGRPGDGRVPHRLQR